MSYDNEEGFFTKYSSNSFEEAFEDYISLKKHIALLPSNIKKDKFTSSNDEKYLNMAALQSGLSKSNQLFFRKTANSNAHLIESWLSGVFNTARVVELSFMTPQFKGLTKEYLSEISKLSVDENIFKKLPKILFEKGIILIYEPSFDGLKLDGAVYRNSSNNPVIVMSLRYKRIDNFWFTLMHELSHIVLHYDKLDKMIIENLDEKSAIQIEVEADRLAQDCLIKRNIWRGSSVRRLPTVENITELATQLNIHKAIIAGRIQREYGKYDLFRALTDSCNVRKKVFE